MQLEELLKNTILYSSRKLVNATLRRIPVVIRNDRCEVTITKGKKALEAITRMITMLIRMVYNKVPGEASHHRSSSLTIPR